jgi:predicted ribosomally synthesized peptide with SipW-like signal peptide
MKNHNSVSAGFVWLPVLLVILALVVVGGGAYAYYSAQQNAIPQIAANQQATTTPSTAQTTTDSSAKSTPASSSQTKTYTNTQYGFSLQYPNAVTVNPNCGEEEPACTGNPLIKFYEQTPQPSNGFAYGYLVVNASTDPATVSSCMTNASPGFGTFSTTQINGIPFTIGGAGSAAAGTQEANTSYHALENGVCYSLDLDEFSHYTGGTFVKSQAQNDLESIVQSLKFASPSATISVTGMSQYTDSSFGFSFWYPTGWTVATQLSSASQFSGGTTQKVIIVQNARNPGNGITISEVNAPSVISVSDNQQRTTTYYFDATSHVWMRTISSDENTIVPYNMPADVSNNTMGGLHILSTFSVFVPTIIPLSAHNFLVIGDTAGGPTGRTEPFAKTITATDPAVATPVSAAQQTATIQAEAAAYAGQ